MHEAGLKLWCATASLGPSHVAPPPSPFPLSLGSLSGLSTRISYSVLMYKKRAIECDITIPFCGSLSIEIWIFIIAFLKHTLPLRQLPFSLILYREKLQAPRRLQRGWDRATISQGSI